MLSNAVATSHMWLLRTYRNDDLLDILAKARRLPPADTGSSSKLTPLGESSSSGEKGGRGAFLPVLPESKGVEG